MASSILDVLDPLIYQNRPAVHEGDIFSVLAYSPYVIRSFEFGLADGAVDCTRSYDLASSYVDRFWEYDHSTRALDSAHEILLFDVKGAVFDQRYSASVAQGNHVAFYIGVCVVDSSFVELIPNYMQASPNSPTPLTSLDTHQRIYLSINSDRDSKLALRVLGLNQTNAPFRMPRCMLKDAIARVRRCVRSQGRETYVNPWTLTSFPDWMPKTTTSSRFIKPLEDTASFTAYEVTMDIYRTIKSQERSTGIQFDFIGLQPRVADFKLVEYSASQHPRQVFVQHKIHTKLLSRRTRFDNVTVVARRTAKKRQWYFSATNRFDFFFFQFMISDDSGSRTEFFFLPERVIPDSFYTSEDTEQSFDREDFLKFKIHMDDDHEWVSRLRDIIKRETWPRSPGQRPLRALTPIAGIDFEMEFEPEFEEENDGNAEKNSNDHTSLREFRENDESMSMGRSLHAKEIKRSHVRFFEEFMRQCAIRRSGLLIALSNDHPQGDFAFSRYEWTDAERATYLSSGRIPRAAHHMPAAAPVISVYLFSRHAGCSFEGPDMKPAVIRRLDSCAAPSIVAWDLVGPDSLQPTPPLLIPSEDIGLTEGQRRVFAREAEVKGGEHNGYTPSLSALLNSGRFAAEYSVAKCGPLIYGNDVWGEVWKMLNAFSGIDVFEHPAGVKRQPSNYRQPLQALHQRLAQEFYHLSGTATRR